MKPSGRTVRRRLGGAISVLLPALVVTACGRDLSPQEDSAIAPPTGPSRERQLEGPGVFGEGVTFDGLLSGGVFGDDDRDDGLPVNKYLWQASLDTLNFLPLVSTDPFTGVIATDWAGSPQIPNERLKVTAYLTSPELEASSLRVAVFRQIRGTDGQWQAASVSPETALKLENAILTRARQIRIAEVQQGTG